MRIAAPLLILLSLAASVEQALVQGLFVLRQDYVATHLCENRHRPEMQCNGKCFLKKRMEETHTHDEERGETGPEVVVAFNLLVPIAAVIPLLPPAPRTYAPAAPVLLQPGVRPDVIHPPEQAV